jgi:hypothetical protein
MCRIYKPKNREAYIRLCCKTGRKGVHIPVSKLEYIPEPGTCYRPNRRTKSKTITNRRKLYTPPYYLPCRVCGVPTIDEVCDKCKPEYTKKCLSLK